MVNSDKHNPYKKLFYAFKFLKIKNYLDPQV